VRRWEFDLRKNHENRSEVQVREDEEPWSQMENQSGNRKNKRKKEMNSQCWNRTVNMISDKKE
jgi:hypothetical protein